jgi:hypothetical protein
VDVDVLPLPKCGGVGGGASSERPPKDPMVADRPLSPRRIGAPPCGEEREERTDAVESVRSKAPTPGEARFIEDAARATWDGEGIGGVLAP